MFQDKRPASPEAVVHGLARRPLASASADCVPAEQASGRNPRFRQQYQPCVHTSFRDHLIS